MNHSLTLSIYLNENNLEELKENLQEVFKTQLIEYSFPYRPEIAEIIKNNRGFGITYKIEIVSERFELAVYNLLKALQIFSIDWICKGPVVDLDNKNTFVASNFKEIGLFNQSYINGVCAVLQEEAWNL